MHRAWLTVVALSACVPSSSAVFGPVDRDVQHRLGVSVSRSDDAGTTAATRALIAKPIGLEAALRIALARNRRLQARFDELGIAASEVAAATVLPPASVDANYKRATSGKGSEIELDVIQDVLDLFQIGQRRGIANAELRGAQARATAATVELAAEVEIAFQDAVAAEQERALAQGAFEVASAAADLVERQRTAGNTTELNLVREQEQRERARIEIGRAAQVVAERRARLATLLGLTRDDAPWTTITELAAPPATLPPLDDLESATAAASLDVVALRADLDAAEARHGYAMIRAILPELGVGVAAARRDGEGWEVGPALRIGIPLFNQQQAPRARARAEARRARDELLATEVELRARVATTRSRLEQAFAEVKQLADVVMPLRARVLAETVLQYNAMNASTFELLVARRDMVDIQRQYIEALRQYWDAVAEQTALRRGAHARPEKEDPR